MQYAYIRVSSADQNTARQEEALLKAGFEQHP
ncbi:recombinase family protein, partial [Salmonella enterica]|nr:recombinase family protein [Salmonella enterica]EJJ5034672.1 recombinase family protein [Salmonella enterica]